jgi:hypothetical protein
MIFPEDARSLEPSASSLIRRRNVLGSIGLTGIGLLATTSTSSAFTFGKSGGTPKVRVPTSSGNSSGMAMRYSLMCDLPEEWAVNNPAASDYYRYLGTLGLQRVSPKQVVESHAKAKGSIWNTLPPKLWWKRMGYVLKVVDRIAREMNVSEVEVISAYRCPAYNARCRGAKAGSWHQANVAADVKFPVRPSKVTAMARELRNLGLFRGGVGGYWNFTHIDARGTNVDW